MMSQIIGLFTYIFVFGAYSFLMSLPLNKGERLYYSILFGLGVLAPTAAIWVVK